MSSIIFTSFNGKGNSSMVFAEELCNATNNKNIIIKNSFNQCTKTIYEVLLNEKPDFLISFGQKPKTDSIFIETQANYRDSLTKFPFTKENSYKTNFNYTNMYTSIKSCDINVCLSKNPGSYFCNHLYYSGLYYINAHNLKTQYIFIHIPTLKNFSSYDELMVYFKNLVSSINN